MTKRGSRRAAARTSLCLLAVLVLSCITSGNRAYAFPRPEPLPGNFFIGDPADEENIMLVNRLKQLIEQKHRVVEQEYEITDEQIEIQALLEAKARERERAMLMEQPPPDYSSGEAEPEALPVPSAMIHDHQHPGKRQDMSLCHFKICNMGRKRQSK
ncbi:PREDICTED: uncharacterized protein LOC108754909 isoform X2 [Trachymyrmex septentrionalis]|uniref:uncharacterized protein LOC108754909 isoform X2 n=1 Tax=Trachymyrmex septentrionalis TaxID=34720 RepID=UPI00084ED29D|nr:PREDICTED: uncharacterized protein LOC108754909 isoform X2 [Trachymyrmex septentrionalis]